MTIPNGFTDDMTIPLPAGVTIERIVGYVLSSEAAGVQQEKQVAELMTWNLPREDAELAWDRACGGFVRAWTGNRANEPRKEKDPIANASYRLCRRDPALMAALSARRFPEQSSPALRRRRWWRFWG